MRGVNKVILVGTLGRDPEVRYAANGSAVANISLATSEQWNDKTTGERQERTEWHRVVFFGKLAEIVGQFARKGSQMYVEGKLQTRKWQDQSGQDRYTTEVVVDSFGGQMQLLGPRPQEVGQNYGQPMGGAAQAPAQPAPTATTSNMGPMAQTPPAQTGYGPQATMNPTPPQTQAPNPMSTSTPPTANPAMNTTKPAAPNPAGDDFADDDIPF